MNYFLAVFVAGLLTACAVANPEEKFFDTMPEDELQKCLAEADAALKEHKPGQLMLEVATKLLEKLDTLKNLEDVDKEVNELLGGPITSDKGQQLIKECDQFYPAVRKATHRGSCGSRFGKEIYVHGKNRDHYLKGYDRLKTLMNYQAVCDLLDDVEEAAAPKA